MLRPAILYRWGLGLLFMTWSLLGMTAGMGYDEARHLLVRTGFSPTDAQVRQFAPLSRMQAVDRMLSATQTVAQTPPPAWVDEAPPAYRRIKGLSEEEKKALLREQIRQGIEMRAWWYEEMLTTPSPLTERMTLFWHNHFVSSQQKVKSAQLMFNQHQLLRQHALGNFGELLHAVAKDPAMLIYLDNATNRRAQPNENFAREVMELFTLGMGNYTEQDIQEVARAFTGWSLDRETRAFRFYRFLHDSGEKTVLGKTGRFDGDDVLDILLAQPQTAEFITTKLWREFVSPEPDPKEIKRLAQVFRAANYEIKPVLRALFTSPAFYAPEHRNVLIKSPVEFLVGTLRQFEIKGMDARLLVLAGKQLNQDVFGPPNVKGWPGGEDWINSTTLLTRKQIIERVFRAQEMPMETRGMQRSRAMQAERALAAFSFDAENYLNHFPGNAHQQREAVARLMLAGAPPDMSVQTGPSETLRQLALDPRYHLK